MLINLSNHPSRKWQAQQMQAAVAQFGSVVDLPFPDVPPVASVSDIAQLADLYTEKVAAMASANEAVVHVMGEMTFTYAMVCRLKAKCYRCVASTTERCVVEEQPGQKTVLFNFVQFRDY